jgi:hypothetical protein
VVGCKLQVRRFDATAEDVRLTFKVSAEDDTPAPAAKKTDRK